MTRRCSAHDSVARNRLFGCAVVAVISAAAIATPPQTALNEWCPVMTDEKIDPEITVEHRGETVAFCCDMCVKKFLANPAKYESRLPQFAKVANATAGEPHGAPEHGHSGSDSLGDHDGSGLADLSGSVDQHGHDHGAGESDDEGEPFLGRLHPIIIHFPIAGMPLAMLGFLVWVRTGHEAFARADAIPLFVATLASIAAVISGNIAHDAMRFSQSLHVIVERHQFVSTVVMVIAVCLSIIRLWRWNGLTGKWRWGYGGGLAIVCALLGYTGFLGGSLVFGPNHLAW